MSELLDAVLEERRQQALAYKEYLAKILDIAQQAGSKDTGRSYPSWVKSDGQRALVDFFWPDEGIAIEIDSAVRNNKQHGWKGNALKRKQVKRAIARKFTDGDDPRIDTLFELVSRHDEYN